ncbi:MAG: hypothetical protein U5N85_16640 [Arcicella sp.]|nr:hypothetical protein [Arcicella sp.]
MSIAELYQKFQSCSGISYRYSPKSVKMSCFFALKGDKFNANSFAQEALSKGAKYVVIDEVIDEAANATDPRCILVEDCAFYTTKISQFSSPALQYPCCGNDEL